MNKLTTSVLSSLVLLAVGTDALAQTKNAKLLGRFNPGGRFNDVWGYRDPATGKEYALLGRTTGIYVVDVSNPGTPVSRGFFSGSLSSGWRSSAWRDMKTYRGFCYVVTERGGGMQILDIRKPDSPKFVKTFRVSGWRNSHNVTVDEDAGVVYVSGARGAGLWIIDVKTDPQNPKLITRWAGSYVHDVTIQDGWAHLAQIFSRRYTILDVSNLSSIRTLGSVRDGGSVFAHNTWPTRDNAFCVVTNERGGGPVAVYDITNKNSPKLLATWHRGGGRVIPHNAMVRDRVSHLSYYTNGYIALDVSDPNKPVEIGSYDTSTASGGFNGAWGAYVQPVSGNVYISDIQSGLFVVKPSGSIAHYGKSAAGTGGRVPELHGFGAAYIGNGNFKLEIESARANSKGVLLLGVAKSSTSLAGLPINVDVSGPVGIVEFTTDGSGKAVINAPVSSSLSAGTVFLQAFVQDAAGPIGLSATDGVELEVFGL